VGGQTGEGDVELSIGGTGGAVEKEGGGSSVNEEIFRA